MDIEFLWHSRTAIAVCKPPNLPTQASGNIESLETVLLEQLGREPGEIWFPHRLDRMVSGVILVALTKRSARLLSGQFASRKPEKTYEAIVEGKVQMETSSPTQWDDYIRKVENRALAEPCDRDDQGAKLATTFVRLIASNRVDGHHTGDARWQEHSRLELSPKTGRMHQLRVQNAMRGHPIVGDDIYGGSPIESPAGANEPRILLHARRLAFHDPENGKWTQVEAKCPF